MEIVSDVPTDFVYEANQSWPRRTTRGAGNRDAMKMLFMACCFGILSLPDTAAAEEFLGLKARIQAVLDTHHVPGASVAIVRDDQIVWAEGIGTAEQGKDRPVTVETLFQAASISKPVAAAGALRLVEDGKFTLGQPVESYLKSAKIPGADQMTLRQLLSHTAGLNVHGFGGYADGPDLGRARPGTVCNRR